MTITYIRCYDCGKKIRNNNASYYNKELGYHSDFPTTINPKYNVHMEYFDFSRGICHECFNKRKMIMINAVKIKHRLKGRDV